MKDFKRGLKDFWEFMTFQSRMEYFIFAVATWIYIIIIIVKAIFEH